MNFYFFILYTLTVICTITKEIGPLLDEYSSKERFLIDEADNYHQLEDLFKCIIKWNDTLINQISKVQTKIVLAYKFIKKCHSEEKLNFNKKKFMILLNLTQRYKSIFIDEKENWLSTRFFIELDHFIRNEDPNKKLESIKNTKKYMKKYNEIIIVLYGLCSKTLAVYKYESYYGKDSNFTNSKILLLEITKIVLPDLEVMKSSAICKEILSNEFQSKKRNCCILKKCF